MAPWSSRSTRQSSGCPLPFFHFFPRTLWVSKLTERSAIWIGTNDLGPSAFFTDNRASLTIVDFVDCVYNQLDTLYDAGARNFVLLNLAPLNHVPSFALPEYGGTLNTQFWPNEDTYNDNV